MSAKRAENKLLALVERRGEIAHRVSIGEPVYEVDVLDSVYFVQYLAATTHNAVLTHVLVQTKNEVLQIEGGTWDPVTFRTAG